MAARPRPSAQAQAEAEADAAETAPTEELVAVEVDEASRALSPDEPAAAETAAETAAQPDDDEIFLTIEDDDDELATITAALETEFAAAPEQGPAPEERSEQSLTEVFDAFREYVADTVGDDDHRTHYDLGIGYKEMGLIEEALVEFEVAGRSPELAREARIMAALCHRERGNWPQAAECYRAALSAQQANGRAELDLRYDLADALEHSGRPSEARELLQQVFDADPGYRDVQHRLQELG